MTKKRIIYSGGVLITAIIAISTLLPYPVHVIDALTRETLPEYGFHIPLLKILFEPMIGLLLFFNRAFYALEEQVFFLIWLILVFILYSAIKLWGKDDGVKRQFILRQLANLPLVVGLWFAFFVIMLFVPLPNNTIINRTPDSILVTTHSHSQFSHDGLIRQNALWAWHKRNGFDAFFISDHNRNGETIDFLTTQRKGDFPIEPLIMCGEEFSGTNHLSLLGLKKKLDTDGYSDEQAIDSVHANGGAVIVNHWFDHEHKSLEYYKNVGVDGFEIENTATNKSYNREQYHRIKDFCESNHLIMVGGLDFHGYGNVCTVWNALEIPGWHQLDLSAKEDAILKVLRSRNQDKLKVLLYTDRPYYTDKNLLWRPFVTVFNYFRTLNIRQVISWIFWIIIGAWLKIRMMTNDRFSMAKVLPVLGILSALFLLVLGGVYRTEIQNVLGCENDVYEEYSTLLFYAGSVFFVYSVIVAWGRRAK